MNVDRILVDSRATQASSSGALVGIVMICTQIRETVGTCKIKGVSNILEINLAWLLPPPSGLADKRSSEPQQWKSYQNRRRASEAIKATFKSIQVKPADFARVLVDDIGFESCELLGTPDDEALPEGFRRPIFCAVKGPGA